ncbi:hypothetical protein G9X68_21685 [Rhizobium sp. WYCCWR 11279]|uniref:hypothetical protein n=1 Tax=Rhizobium TaxID=379 RepID=UPI00149183A5|nr:MULTISPECIES: hypothetical protein [Rhizobium]MCV9941739.1 hypothetical protein [Rhizobium sp. BT-175]MCW0016307.1 hypothetical protein [Rhizobium sp. BT-226]NNU49687.1 hypothetical protein [Rhizobium changzhiense]
MKTRYSQASASVACDVGFPINNTLSPLRQGCDIIVPADRELHRRECSTKSRSFSKNLSKSFKNSKLFIPIFEHPRLQANNSASALMPIKPPFSPIIIFL